MLQWYLLKWQMELSPKTNGSGTYRCKTTVWSAGINYDHKAKGVVYEF